MAGQKVRQAMKLPTPHIDAMHRALDNCITEVNRLQPGGASNKSGGAFVDINPDSVRITIATRREGGYDAKRPGDVSLPSKTVCEARATFRISVVGQHNVE